MARHSRWECDSVTVRMPREARRIWDESGLTFPEFIMGLLNGGSTSLQADEVRLEKLEAERHIEDTRHQETVEDLDSKISKVKKRIHERKRADLDAERMVIENAKKESREERSRNGVDKNART